MPTTQQRAESVQALNLPAAERERLAKRVIASTVFLMVLNVKDVSPPDKQGRVTFKATNSRGSAVVLTEDDRA